MSKRADSPRAAHIRKDSFSYEYNLGISAAFESTNLELAEGDQNRQRAKERTLSGRLLVENRAWLMY